MLSQWGCITDYVPFSLLTLLLKWTLSIEQLPGKHSQKAQLAQAGTAVPQHWQPPTYSNRQPLKLTPQQGIQPHGVAYTQSSSTTFLLSWKWDASCSGAHSQVGIFKTETEEQNSAGNPVSPVFFTSLPPQSPAWRAKSCMFHSTPTQQKTLFGLFA